MPHLPTEKEINPYDDLDGRSVARHLLGKSVDEATELLCENSIHYYEDYTWMGPAAFCYYAPALVAYLDCPEAEGDVDVTYFLISCFRSRIENDGIHVFEAISTMQDFCSAVESRFSYLGFDDEYRLRFLRRVNELDAAIKVAQPQK